SLRRAIGLPDHNQFSAGIYHDFTPYELSQPNLEDEEHKEEENKEEVDDSDENMNATGSNEAVGLK
ncbi:hypothetical protein PHMEG_00021244, partial [Phytophthora megakarya]